MKFFKSIKKEAEPISAPYKRGTYDHRTHPTQRHPGQLEEPEALERKCPVCVANVGEWCGGRGDIHEERK